MIINAFKDKIFPLSPEEGLSESVGRDKEEDEKTTPTDMSDLRTSIKEYQRSIKRYI